MNTKIVLDIGGVLLPESFSRKTLMQDFAENGEAHVDRKMSEEIDLCDIYTDAATLEGGMCQLVERIQQKAGLGEHQPAKVIVDYVCQQLAAKNKDPLFLDLMGRVNLASLEAGKVRPEFYQDVPGALARWWYNRQKVHTYSNGSVEFQRAMFKAASCGNLSSHISAYFDTAVIGKKTEPSSYSKIAEILETSPGEIEYFSDDTSELKAAVNAGCRVWLVDRENKHPELRGIAKLV